MATAIEEPPKSMAPGLGTVGGAPADADSQLNPLTRHQQRLIHRLYLSHRTRHIPRAHQLLKTRSMYHRCRLISPLSRLRLNRNRTKGPLLIFLPRRSRRKSRDQAKPGPPADFPAEPAKVGSHPRRCLPAQVQPPLKVHRQYRQYRQPQCHPALECYHLKAHPCQTIHKSSSRPWLSEASLRGKPRHLSQEKYPRASQVKRRRCRRSSRHHRPRPR